VTEWEEAKDPKDARDPKDTKGRKDAKGRKAARISLGVFASLVSLCFLARTARLNLVPSIFDLPSR
jgi:hypothetical protein